MLHFFESSIAVEYGIEEAIILSYLNFWIAKNKANNRHLYDDDYWTYNSLKAFSELFPYMSEKKVYRIISSLKEKGLIKTGNYNENRYDRTNWYALSDTGKALFGIEKSNSLNQEIDFSKSSNQDLETERPIPVNNTDINLSNNTDIKKINKKESEINKTFEIFRQTYPGTKRGLAVELKEMQKHKDWTECLDLLLPALEKEIAYKKTLEKKKVFVPQWKNLSTWIKQRCWEQEFAAIDDGKLEFERDSDGKYSEYF